MRVRVVLPALLRRTVVLAVVWWAVSEGSTEVGLLHAAAVVAAAAATSLWLAPPSGRRLRPLAAVRFGLWFLRQSLRGGTDVALRALAPRPRIDPGRVDYPLRLRNPSAAVLLADTVSLLPGTLVVAVHPDRLTLHVLDRGRAVQDEVAEAERQVAAALGVGLPD